MTLAGIAYAFPEDIPRFLAKSEMTARDGWVPTWVPEEQDGYFAYVAASPRTNSFAVAVRGTNPSFTGAFIRNVVSDVKVWSATEWDHATAAGARIAAGANEGLSVLISLRDEHGDRLAEHLQKTVPAGATVVVTGHSLGGCLASVLAMHLDHAAAGRFRVRPITFAAPTAGDAHFAELYQSRFPDAERYFNRLDLVPRAWHDLDQFRNLYEPPGPKCPPGFGLLARQTSDAVSRFGYTQPGAGIPLPTHGDGSLRRSRGGGLMARVVWFLRERVFLAEALYQHMPDSYLDHLGAPKLPFRLPLPWLLRNTRRRLSRLLKRK
jgi:hypothetical protein